MSTIRGIIQNGVVMPDEPLEEREGSRVLITLLDAAYLGEDPTLEQVVANIVALGPNSDNYAPPTQSLTALLADAESEESVDSEEWDRQWAAIEADMKRRDLANDLDEGRI